MLRAQLDRCGPEQLRSVSPTCPDCHHPNLFGEDRVPRSEALEKEAVRMLNQGMRTELKKKAEVQERLAAVGVESVVSYTCPPTVVHWTTDPQGPWSVKGPPWLPPSPRQLALARGPQPPPPPPLEDTPQQRSQEACGVCGAQVPLGERLHRCVVCRRRFLSRCCEAPWAGKCIPCWQEEIWRSDDEEIQSLAVSLESLRNEHQEECAALGDIGASSPTPRTAPTERKSQTRQRSGWATASGPRPGRSRPDDSGAKSWQPRPRRSAAARRGMSRSGPTPAPRDCHMSDGCISCLISLLAWTFWGDWRVGVPAVQ